MKQSIGKKPAIIPTPVLIIGTYDHTGKPNAMTAAWGGICSSDPLSISFSVQRTRHTYTALVEQRECTINLPSTAHVKEADYFGVSSGKDRNKFSDTGLTPIRAPSVHAPYVAEFPVAIECRITQIIEVGVHDLFVAEVVDVLLDDSCIDKEGKIEIQKVPFFYYNPLDRSYYKTGDFLMEGFSTRSLFT